MSEPKRIALFGPESTGKSVLAERLAARFGEPWVPEYVREFWDQRNGVIVAADLADIARGQIDAEEAALAKAKRGLFCDTELLTNVLWADLLFPGKCPPWVREAAEQRCRNYAVYLLCDTDIPFTPDPQRSFPDAAGREMCRQLWRQTLESRQLPFVEIRGDWTQREARAFQAVESVFNSAPFGLTW